MSTHASLRITYWAMQNSAESVEDLQGLDEFGRELSDEYVTNVRARPAGLGGGFYELAVEVLSNITLLDFLSFLGQGIAFDLIKSGTKALVLKPFLSAFKKLKERNPDKQVDIERLTIVFQDTTVVVHKITDDSIFDHLQKILETLLACSTNLTLQTAERPVELHIPVFPDPSPDPLSRFRVKFEIEEDIKEITTEDYFKFWGLYYDFSQFRVLDVANRLLIDARFHTEESYTQDRNQRRYFRELERLKKS